MLAAAAVAALLEPATTSVPSSSPTAEIITATAAGVATLLAAGAGVIRLRRNRDAAADATPVGYVDPEDRPARMRERLSAAEARLTNVERRIEDLSEVQTLHRAADVAYESAAAPRRRRPSRES